MCSTLWPGDLQTTETFCVSKTISTWLCSVMGVPMITGSQAVPVITFLKFSFWKTKHKKNHCLDMFFIYQNLYCFKNRQAIIPMTSFSLSGVLLYELSGRFSTIWLCFLSLSCHTDILLCIWIEWLRCVSLRMLGLYLYVCDCVCFVSVCMCDWHDGLYCQLNYPVLQVRKGRNPVVKRRKSLPVIILKCAVDCGNTDSLLWPDMLYLLFALV